MRKYTVIVTEDENNRIKLSRENDGFTILELLGILDILREDIHKQAFDQNFADKVIEHKRVVVDKE